MISIGTTAGWKLTWSRITNIQKYEAALGYDYTNPSLLTMRWDTSSVENKKIITGITLPVAKVTRLLSEISPLASTITVVSSEGFPDQGRLYLGSEIIEYDGKLGTDKILVKNRGIGGSLAQTHLPGEVVSNQAFVFSVRAVSSLGSAYIPSMAGRPLLMYRTDVTEPTVPGAPKVMLAQGEMALTYQIDWQPSLDPESRAFYYEIQEREDTNPVWRTIALIPANKTGGADNSILLVGDPTVQTQGYAAADAPRQSGHFYSYRVRTYNAAGAVSVWSSESAPASTGQIPEAVKNVSNYPNPVDTRQGGYTTVTYLLGADSDVTITIYDLLGYKVHEWHFNPGDPGGWVDIEIPRRNF
ncbi:MAG: hypothetical protein HY747_02730 [Elusimicrobia bacterium]|nr:hypothetical protein [Elusimicrobiota bacterium]